MSVKIRKRTNAVKVARYYRKARIRKQVSGTAECPRMNVFKSATHFVVQLINDEVGHTVAQCSTMEKDMRDKVKANIAGAKLVGQRIAEVAKKNNIKKVVFDRNGYKYHGAIKALAEAARQAGLEF